MSPTPALIGNTTFGTWGFFSSDWPVAYLIATVIFGIGLLIGSPVYVSQPVQVARQSSVPSRVDAEPKRETVGRITGMADCRWEKGSGFRVQSSEPVSVGQWQWSGAAATESILNPQPILALVSLGDKFVLSSGLMEITYDTGAKVILQGPVKYEVESSNGGFLSVGKLTARLERKSGAVASGQNGQ